jgi:putative aldouronate transport system substrate-binding protein
LFDEEGITQNFQEYTAKGSTEDAIVGSYITWYKHFVAGPRVDDYEAMAPLEGPGGERTWPIIGGKASAIFPQTFSISSSNEYPEAAFRWADMFYEKEKSIEMQFGTLGVVIGKNEDGTYRYLPVPDGMQYAEFRFQHTSVDGPSAIFPEDLNTLIPRFDIMEEKYRDIQELYQQFMTTEEMPDVYMTREENDTRVRLIGDINSFVEETHARWLLQGGVEDEWAPFIDRLNRMGLQEVIDVHQSAYDRFLDVME